MTFTYDVEIPTEDGKDTEEVTFTLKDVTDIPVGILRRNRRNQEALTWATFEWGLDPEQLDDFDRLTAKQVVDFWQAWQESGLDEGDKPQPNRATRRKQAKTAKVAAVADDDED